MLRKEIAKIAANERWHPKTPRATHSGVLIIGDVELACDVLQDGRVVVDAVLQVVDAAADFLHQFVGVEFGHRGTTSFGDHSRRRRSAPSRRRSASRCHSSAS